MEMEIPPPVGFSSISVTKDKRAWSPSQPIPDSSDDEEPGPSASRKPEPLPLSTFRPVPNLNVYPVPDSEYATSGKARILVLQPNETLALVGTYSFCVLQGSLSLLGVTLSPSNTKHIVFAPRSSPIPVLSWATSDRQGFCTFPIPLAIQQQANLTAILIEYADTGVEGLGRICKVFENVFKPPRGSDAVLGVDLPGIHIVRHDSLNYVVQLIHFLKGQPQYQGHPSLCASNLLGGCACICRRASKLGDEPCVSVFGERTEEEREEYIGANVSESLAESVSDCARIFYTLSHRLHLSRYRRVAFLECDLGQSEFTPGGLVALNLVENYAFGESICTQSHRLRMVNRVILQALHSRTQVCLTVHTTSDQPRRARALHTIYTRSNPC